MKLKKLLSAVLATAIAVSSVSVTSLSAAAEDTTLTGSCGDDATWKLTSDGVLVLSGTGGVNSYSGWYTYRYDVEEVVIQEGITSASYDILGINSCPNVKKIILPTTFTNLKGMSDSFAFLEDVYVYSTELSQSDISLNKGTFPKASSGVKWHVYKDSTAETVLRTVLNYTDDDFEFLEGDKPEDPQYTAAVISEQSETSGPSGVGSVWSWDESSKTLTFSGTGSISIKTGYSQYSASVEKVVIGDGITFISQGAFRDFLYLASVEFADSVKFIGDYAFSGTKLTEFIAPTDLIEIGYQAFYQLPIEKIELNEKLKKIGTSAFEGTNVTSIKFLSGDIYVGQQAFSRTKLTDIELCEGMSFGGTVFSYCNDLLEVVVPKGCTYGKNGEGNAARANKLFMYCLGLEKVIFEDEAAIAEAMFMSCTALKDVYILTKTASISISGPSYDTANSMFEGTPVFHIYKGSTTEAALKTAGYITDDSDNVVYLADMTALEEKISEAEALDESLYTEESFEAVKNAVLAADEILKNIDAAQDDVDVAAKAIEDAIAGLELKVVTGTVSGMVNVSDENAETEMTVKAVAADGTETTVKATSMGTYTLEGLPVGEYTLTISGGNYAERMYEVTVAEGENAQDVELNLRGDINGDGKVTTADVGLANSHAKGVKALEGYAFVCANVSGDELVSTADVGMINSHAKSVKTLW